MFTGAGEFTVHDDRALISPWGIGGGRAVGRSEWLWIIERRIEVAMIHAAADPDDFVSSLWHVRAKQRGLRLCHEDRLIAFHGDSSFQSPNQSPLSPIDLPHRRHSGFRI